MRNEVISAIEKNKIIAILRGVPQEKLISVAEALYQGGIRLMEITYSADGRVSDEDTAAAIRMLAGHMRGRMYIGAGTVLTEKQVRLTKEAGGLFIISPNTDEKVIRATVEQSLVSMPGALTPTEIVNAHNAGADFVKLFPAADFGIKYVKAVTAPLSHIKLLAVGGVTEDNIPDFFKAGVCGFGIGTNIIDKKLIASEDYDGISVLAQRYVQAVENA